MRDTLIVIFIASIIFGSWALYKRNNESQDETSQAMYDKGYQAGFKAGLEEGKIEGMTKCRMDPESCLF